MMTILIGYAKRETIVTVGRVPPLYTAEFAFTAGRESYVSASISMKHIILNAVAHMN